MFQIPDDEEDDEFWKEFPLEEFGNHPANKGEKRQASPLQKHPEEHKKPCTRNLENIPSNKRIGDSSLLLFNSANSNNETVQDDHLLHRKLTSAANLQKPGGQFENLPSSDRVHQTPSSIPGNCIISEQQEMPPNERCPKRKFPGPAGMLPRLGPGHKLTDTVMKVDGRTSEVQLQKNDNFLLSPNPVDDLFGESPWLKLVADLGENSSKILKSFSIKELHNKACKKQLYQGKVPLLFTVLETVDLSSIDASVRLRDKTGSIQGTIHRNLVKEYGEHLQPSTVLVLRQVGVLSPTPRTHYLNITANNLVSLYSMLPSGQVGIKWQEKNMTYHQLLASTEMLQRSHTSSSPAQLPANLRKPQKSPSIKTMPVAIRQPLSAQKNMLQNVDTNTFTRNFQTNVCDNKTPRFPLQNPAVSLSNPKPYSTTPGRSSISNKEPDPATPTILQNRSRWSFKSNTSFSKQISGPSLSSSSSCVPVSSAQTPGALISSLRRESSCHPVGNENLESSSVSCTSVSASTGDRYRLKGDNSTTITESDSSMADIWQDELPDDILSQMSEDLF